MPKYTTPENFGAQVKKIADRINADVEEVAETAVKDLFREIIEGTPVGKPETWKYPAPPGYIPGKAKANWMISIGEPDTSVTESRESSVKRLSRLDGNVAGNVVYIANHVPYIYRLEYLNWSPQAKGGWVRKALRSFESKLEKAAQGR